MTFEVSSIDPYTMAQLKNSAQVCWEKFQWFKNEETQTLKMVTERALNLHKLLGSTMY